MNEAADHNILHLSPDGLTTAQLLQLELVCDRFEADFNSGKGAIINEYVAQLPPELHARARAELQALEECLQRSCPTQVAEPTRQGAADGATAGQDTLLPEDRADAVPSRQSPCRTIRAGRFELHELLGSGGPERFGKLWIAT